jgi:hypothetical protein
VLGALEAGIWAWSEQTGETAQIGLALVAVKKQLCTAWYRARDGTLTGADFQVATLPLWRVCTRCYKKERWEPRPTHRARVTICSVRRKVYELYYILK